MWRRWTLFDICLRLMGWAAFALCALWALEHYTDWRR